MLSDKSIRRDVNYSLARRSILKVREIIGKKRRSNINININQKLEGIDFTIFSNNCLGGVFYHDAGRQFTSPTINTAFDGEDFIKFLERPHHYFSSVMKFIKWPGHNYPIARIDDIEVRFVHYKSNEECEKKWHERAERIVWDNIFIVATNHDGMYQAKCLERFDKLPYKNKIMFVSNPELKYEWAVLVPQFKNRWQVRIMTNYANIKGERYYETCFDIAQWIKNESRS